MNRTVRIDGRTHIGSVPYLGVAGSPSWMPRRAASRAAAPRLDTPSLVSTDDTWWSTVFADTTSCSAISVLRRL